jgi:hypothetical protein
MIKIRLKQLIKRRREIEPEALIAEMKALYKYERPSITKALGQLLDSDVVDYTTPAMKFLVLAGGNE